MNREELEEIIKKAPAPHIPEKLPFDTFKLVNQEIFKLTTKASKALGEYTGFLINTPNPGLLLSPITTQEAVLSSKLEGTHATLEDIFNHEAGIKTQIQDDEIKEILNYRKALNYAITNISTINNLSQSDSKDPLTLNIIKEMHRILLDNVRGSSKHPGRFKVSQNYIGGSNHISFTPLPAQFVEEYMSNLERYIHYDESDLLIQAAIIHAQFEMIHPFEDGNGRIGRLLIPLFFYYTELIPLPTFYMSSYFNADRDLYIQKLSNISKNNEWQEWIIYFLKGIIMQALLNTKKANAILALYNEYKDNAKDIRSYHYIEVLDFIFQHPIFNVSQLIDTVCASKQTLYNILNKMVELKMLSVTPKNKNRTFIFEALINIVDQ